MRFAIFCFNFQQHNILGDNCKQTNKPMDKKVRFLQHFAAQHLKFSAGR